MTQVIAIVGPTAVGKSDLADRVALRLGSEVVSADAMQVYRGMDIGTAKVPLAERLVPLNLVDVVDPGVAYSAALYQHDARLVIDSLLERNLVPIVCGGTGLYIRAALDEMSFPKGEISSKSRSRYDELAESLGPEGLHDVLAQRDQRSANAIHPNNVRRVVRALEMLDEGVSYADQKEAFSHIQAHYDTRYYCLTLPRDVLYDRINKRVDLMVEHGLVDEVERLVGEGFADSITSRQAIGYKEIIEVLEGKTTLEDAVETIKLRSRRYAKRQLSWFKRDSRIVWLDLSLLGPDGALEKIISDWNGSHV